MSHVSRAAKWGLRGDDAEVNGCDPGEEFLGNTPVSAKQPRAADSSNKASCAPSEEDSRDAFFARSVCKALLAKQLRCRSISGNSGCQRHRSTLKSWFSPSHEASCGCIGQTSVRVGWPWSAAVPSVGDRVVTERTGEHSVSSCVCGQPYRLKMHAGDNPPLPT